MGLMVTLLAGKQIFSKLAQTLNKNAAKPSSIRNRIRRLRK